MRALAKILPALVLGGMLSLASPALAMQSNIPEHASRALHTLTAPSEWLNTSRPLKAEDLKGRVILLDFWTYCCINCMHVIPDLHYLEKKFGDKLTVIGVHSAKFANERDAENIRQAMLRYDIEHPVVNDADFAIWNTFDVQAWPTFMLIAPDGAIVQVYSGEGHRQQLESDIGMLIRRAGDALRTDPLPLALEKDKVPETVLQFPAKLEVAAKVEGAPMFFVSDSGHHRILGIRPNGDVAVEIGSGVQGLQDGSFAEAQFHSPQGVLWDAENDILFVADTENHALRAVDMQRRTVTTLAGDGTQGGDRVASNQAAGSTHLASPWDVAFYPDNQHILIAMAGTHQLWSYDRKHNTLSVAAGNGRESIDDGIYPFNSLSQPSGIAVDGDTAYFVDSETSSLRRLQGKTVKTLIGTGLFDFGYKEGGMGVGLMQHPLGIYADTQGVYIADSYNHAIRLYDRDSGQLRNFAGTGERGNQEGPLAQARFNEPNDVDMWQGKLYVTDTNNHRIRVIDVAAGQVRSLPVMPMAAESSYSYDDALPSVESLPEQDVASVGTRLQLGLSEGWKLNADAPSYLALFTADEYELVEQYEREALRKGVTLPKLAAGQRYILQGTLYYCEDKEGSICLIKSVEKQLSVEEGGETRVTVPVK